MEQKSTEIDNLFVKSRGKKNMLDKVGGEVAVFFSFFFQKALPYPDIKKRLSIAVINIRSAQIVCKVKTAVNVHTKAADIAF